MLSWQNYLYINLHRRSKAFLKFRKNEFSNDVHFIIKKKKRSIQYYTSYFLNHLKGYLNQIQIKVLYESG